MTNTLIVTKLKQARDLSPSERHLSEYILSNLYAISDMGIVELAEAAYTSTATIRRLLKKMGIDSYTDFRLGMQSYLASYESLNIIESAQSPVDEYDTLEDIIKKVSNQNAKSIIDTANSSSKDTIDKVVGLMMEAKRIDFYGVGPSNLVAKDAYYKCLRLSIPASAHEDRISMLINARSSEPGVLGFLISYTGETDEMLEVAETLSANGITTVSLTSMSENHLAGLCTHNLYVQSGESWDRLGGMSSRISSLNQIDILFTALINSNPVKYRERMQITNVPSYKRSL